MWHLSESCGSNALKQKIMVSVWETIVNPLRRRFVSLAGICRWPFWLFDTRQFIGIPELRWHLWNSPSAQIMHSFRKSCSGQSAQAAWQTRHGKTAGEQSIHKIFNPFLTICWPGCRDTLHLGDVHLLSPSRLLKSDPIYSVNISEYCIFLQKI